MYKLHIGNKNYSSWSFRPWLLMTELTIPFKEQMNPFAEDSNWDKFRSFSPTGLVPCLEDLTAENKLAIWDSLAIIEYLAEDYPNVWPAQKEARAWARSAAAEMHSGFSYIRNQWPMNCALRIEPFSISSCLQKELNRLEELWNEGLSRFSGPYLAGDKFTAVDAFYAPIIFRFRTFGYKLTGKPLEYYNLMHSIDSVQRWDSEAIVEPWREVSHELEFVETGKIIKDHRENQPEK
ncbi:MAG: glutathione S-transferase [Gammaproteobacteria bacterium]|nr:MAG: glutathione S-transferase [Gammaproteobacteria bacterium]